MIEQVLRKLQTVERRLERLQAALSTDLVTKALAQTIAGIKTWTTLQVFEAGITLGRGIATVSNGFINAPRSLVIAIDSDNDQTDRVLTIMKDAASGAGGVQIFRINEAGNAAIGTNTTPTARLHLPAGTATASTAPLKLTAGTNLTVVENGTFEYDGTNLFFTTGGVRHTIV